MSQLPIGLLVLCLSAVAVLPGRASAQEESEVDLRSRRISSQVMSPFCPGRVLSECPSPSAAEWRSDIREWVSEGVPAPQIRERLEARMPDENIVGRPKSSGGWLLFGMGLLLAVLLPLFLLFRKRLSKGGVDGKGDRRKGAATKEDRALDARLDQELSELD